MNLRAAAQQALEAFEWNYNTDLDNIPACEQWAKMLKENITALRAALAEPQTTHWEGCEAVHPECGKTERQWVSLTEQEMYDLFFNDQYGPRLPEYLVNTIKCVEAKLKEKNT